MSAASKPYLQELHKMLAEGFTARVVKWKKGEADLPAAELAVIVKFLKDSEITALALPGSPLGDLKAALEDDLPFSDHAH